MKNFLLISGVLVGVLIIIVAGLAVLNICPPSGPWPQPPWCPGSTMSWPFGKNETNQVNPNNPVITKNMSEGERLAMVAIGLISDLTTVNTYYQTATNSMGEVSQQISTIKNTVSDQISSRVFAKRIQRAPYLPQMNQIPTGFTDPISQNGSISAPSGACALGAMPTASFQNGGGNTITADFLKKKGIKVVDFTEINGDSMDGSKLRQTITGYIGQGGQELTTASGWNNRVWNKVTQLQTPADSLLDYHLWTIADEIEKVVADSIRNQMVQMGLPTQVLKAFDASNHDQWMTNKKATTEDKISAMEIEAVFTGRTQGTIQEKREFSLPTMGKMPQFGPMTGEGSVVYKDTELGDYSFDLTLNWTKWDEMGRVTAGTTTFVDSQHGYEIKLEILEDNSREGEIYLQGKKTGLVHMDSSGKVTYEDLTK